MTAPDQQPRTGTLQEGRTLLYLARHEVEATSLSLPEMIALLHTVFAERAAGRVEMPPKPGLHPVADAFIHAMPAYIPALNASGIKWIAGYPENPRRGLSYITGLLILNRPDTGVPLCVMDATWLTAMRTAAVTGLSVRYLARPGARTAAILGCGVQGRVQLAALHHVCPCLATVRCYDIRRPTLDAYVAEMRVQYPALALEPVAAPEQAVRGAEIVITAGPILKQPQPAIERAWLAEGVLGLPLDFDSYWQGPALHAAQQFVVDDLGQYRYYQQEGFFSTAPAVTAELSEVVAGRKPGRVHAAERIIAMNLGVAMADVAVARRIYDLAVARGLGTVLPL